MKRENAGLRMLGELESAIMRDLWIARAPATVRQVHARLAGDRELAYTTVMTVMDRLHRKGLLRRNPRGRAFEYEPAVAEAEYTANLMKAVLSTSADPHSALAHFVSGMTRKDVGRLRALIEQAGAERQSP